VPLHANLRILPGERVSETPGDAVSLGGLLARLDIPDLGNRPTLPNWQVFDTARPLPNRIPAGPSSDRPARLASARS